jgi:hypothetical protein
MMATHKVTCCCSRNAGKVAVDVRQSNLAVCVAGWVIRTDESPFRPFRPFLGLVELDE